MQLNKVNNIIFLKDLESNIIEQAVIVLKENINFVQYEKTLKKPIDGNKVILNEAESLINNELKINDLKFEEFKFKKLNNKYKILKFINILLVCSLIAVYCFFIK